MSLALYRKYRPGTFSRGHRPGPRHRAAAAGDPQRQGAPRLPVLGPARLRQDLERPHPGPLAQLRTRARRPTRAASATRASRWRPTAPAASTSSRSTRPRTVVSTTPVTCANARSTPRSRASSRSTSSTRRTWSRREGFNALLKLVEEPPAHLKFIFATTEPEKVIGTIRSRTHHYPFRLVPPRELLGLVQNICAQEGVEVDPLVLPLVVRAGAGSARDSLSVLDQLLAGAGPEGLTYARAVALLGFTDAALLDEIDRRLRRPRRRRRLRDRRPGGRERPRPAPVRRRPARAHPRPAHPRGGARRVEQGTARRARRTSSSAWGCRPPGWGRPSCPAPATSSTPGLVEMRGTTAPRLMLELICARVLLPAAARDESSMLARLDRLERRLEVEGAPLAAPRPAVAAAPAPADLGCRTPQPQPRQRRARSGSASGRPPGRRRPSAVPTPARCHPCRRRSRRRAGHARRGRSPQPRRARRPPPSWRDPAAAAPPEPAAAEPAAAASLPRCRRSRPSPAASLDAAAVRRLWPDVLEAIKTRRKMTTWALLASTPRSSRSPAAR